MPGSVEEDGSVVNILVPNRNSNVSPIQKLVKKVGKDCQICQLQRGLQELDAIIANNLPPKVFSQEDRLGNPYLDPQYIPQK